MEVLKWNLSFCIVNLPLLEATILNVVFKFSSVNIPALSVIATKNSPKSIVPLLSTSAILKIFSINAFASAFEANLLE